MFNDKMIEGIIIPIVCFAITGGINAYINNNQIKRKKREFSKRTAYITKINNDLKK